uniref:Uncharacterized protein n=1 Tax=Arundo donax TaxID=35708 RepID=A0A0A9BZ06_ARUDO
MREYLYFFLLLITWNAKLY